MERGFMDSFLSIFSSIKPTLRNAGNNIGSFLKQNKDRLVKPIIGAVGDLAATGISKGIPTLLTRIINRRAQKLDRILREQQPQEIDQKGIDVLNGILKREGKPALSSEIPTTNIIGDGLGKKKKYGKGLKKF